MIPALMVSLTTALSWSTPLACILIAIIIPKFRAAMVSMV